MVIDKTMVSSKSVHRRSSSSSPCGIFLARGGKGDGSSSSRPKVAAVVKCESPNDKLRSGRPPLFLTGGRRRRRPSGGVDDLREADRRFTRPTAGVFPCFHRTQCVSQPSICSCHQSEEGSDEFFKFSHWPGWVLHEA